MPFFRCIRRRHASCSCAVGASSADDDQVARGLSEDPPTGVGDDAGCLRCELRRVPEVDARSDGRIADVGLNSIVARRSTSAPGGSAGPRRARAVGEVLAMRRPDGDDLRAAAWTAARRCRQVRRDGRPPAPARPARAIDDRRLSRPADQEGPGHVRAGSRRRAHPQRRPRRGLLRPKVRWPGWWRTGTCLRSARADDGVEARSSASRIRRATGQGAWPAWLGTMPTVILRERVDGGRDGVGWPKCGQALRPDQRAGARPIR